MSAPFSPQDESLSSPPPLPSPTDRSPLPQEEAVTQPQASPRKSPIKSESGRASDPLYLESLLALQQNVKQIPPWDRSSELRQCLFIDHASRLTHLLDLAEYHYDIQTENAKILRSSSNGGLLHFLYTAVDLAAPNCLMALINYSSRPGNPYSFDRKLLFEYAKQACTPEGPGEWANIACCLRLIQEGMNPPSEDPSDIADLLMPLAKTAKMVHQIAPLWNRNPYAFVLPALVDQCGRRTSSPGVIASLCDLTYQKKEDISTVFHGRLTEEFHKNSPKGRWSRTAVSEACYSLNIEGFHILLQRRAKIDPAVIDSLRDPYQAACNPLYRLLGRRIPLPVPNTVGLLGEKPDPEGPKLERIGPGRALLRKDDYSVYLGVYSDLYGMLSALETLAYCVRRIRGGYFEGKECILMYRECVRIYGSTLRFYVLQKIRRHLPLRVQETLIEEKPDEEKPKSPVTKGTGQSTRTEPGWESEYRFRPEINGEKLQETLERYDLGVEPVAYQIWNALMMEAPENFEWLAGVCEQKIRGARVVKQMEVMYEFILDPESREDVSEEVEENQAGGPLEGGLEEVEESGEFESGDEYQGYDYDAYSDSGHYSARGRELREYPGEE